MKKTLLLCSGIILSSIAYSAEWKDITLEDGLDQVKAVQIESASKEESISIFRKSPKRSNMSMYPKEMVFIEFKTESLDQINARGPVIYKASKGKAYPLGSNSRLAGLTGRIQTTAFHGKSSPTCGIIGNIINSDKLTIRYETAGDKTKDVVFDIPKDSSPLFNLLGFDKTKDCVEIN
ncbi:hypothetical protein [Acinetobacter radioresistens]|uniref:hypothetical protein n=1 Tax=Acinetobacter radioresistens TaxID=40216 RepID=UPI002003D626|nr:hypothetical protein [Acinetobacter radioresistens]MCK4081312.1 hypothetical protein [Acinetobacter radioresistens]